MLGNKILYYLSGFLKAKAIRGPNGEPYLERYMLLRFKNHTVFLHRFLASDPDRGVHDHPWAKSVSLIVCGQYLEKRLVAKDSALWMRIKSFKAGDLNVIRGNDFHQLVLVPGKPAWSIFYHGPRVKDWGFAIGDRSKSMEEGDFTVSEFEPYIDRSDPQSKWELEAPRGRNLATRMPERYRLGS